MKILLLSIFLLLFTSCKREIIELPIEQTKRCFTDEPHDQLLSKNYIPNRPAFKTDTAEVQNTIITVPVVFHVIYNPNQDSRQNVPLSQIQNQLDILNRDFAKTNSDTINTPTPFKSLAGSTKIRFCLAQRDEFDNPHSGVIRKSTTKTQWSAIGDMKCPYLGGDTAWDNSKYLNIWVCNIVGCLGYANYPGGNPPADGVVLSYKVCGTPGILANYNGGRTLTHEIGHFLGIHHLGWSGCLDDEVLDTPLQGAITYNCPSFPKLDACNNSPYGILFMNFMDSSYDPCYNLFTKGQCAKMDSALRYLRTSLIYSRGCSPLYVLNPTATPTGIEFNKVYRQ